MIFPGMDPYLENPTLWPGLHTALVVYIRDQLQPQLRPRYAASIEERVYLQGANVQRVPDVWVQRAKGGRRNGGVAVIEADAPLVVKAPVEEIHERYVTILDVQANEKLVTLIEVVSPTNKKRGEGRESYLTKQRETWQSDVHLVEIDLLRRGKHVLLIPETAAREKAGDYDYLCCVNRAQKLRDRFDLYPTRLPDRLPRIAVPLKEEDDDVVLDLQRIIEVAYEHASYDLRVRYEQPCVPSLGKRQTWANQVIRKSGQLRRNK